MSLGQALIAEEEGTCSATVYYVAGLAHIAQGCCVDAKVAGAGLCQAALDAQNAYDYQQAVNFARALAGYGACSPERQAVLESMCFQLGSLVDWTGFKAALAVADYAMCSQQMLYRDGTNPAAGFSEWHSQTTERCEREAYIMRSGEWLARGAPIPSAIA